MVLVLPDWVWWVVLVAVGFFAGNEYRKYRDDPQAWMKEWFD
ncbi:hypothetical protein YK48G_04330 [Lentilactobacillus fungorum]|uniref:Uncharacterized protein n=1 Tax=Lentilactobacillus fungorum TaxID=2201250 RepID=A0ABQ3VVU3_9LACO|nr:hypothetical protein [Lentilactobacillus fungorum]GHP13008.1 hypothetical protein YK48G_04330 [Lentilactobacillus fungorum]